MGLASEDLDVSLESTLIALISYFHSRCYLPGASIPGASNVGGTQYCLTEGQENG